MQTTLDSDWISPPGDTINEILAERKVTIQQLAEITNLHIEICNELLIGKALLSDEIAIKLSQTIGGTEAFWKNRETQYRNQYKKLKETPPTSFYKAWLDELPINDMKSFGWIKSSNDITTLTKECLNFFGINDILEWRQKYGSLLQSGTAYKTTKSFDAKFGAVATWLRQGEKKAESIYCNRWNPEKFHQSLEKIRDLTRIDNPQTFIPQLTKICADSGIALVIARAPNGCRASGATRFLTSDKAIILLSFRHLTDDHFWFSFFHEAGHLLLHSNKLILEDLDGNNTAEEEEANSFAANTLIPQAHQHEFKKLGSDPIKIIRFARNLRISRGVVVGQLQYFNYLRKNQLNNLKIRFQWKV